MTIQYTSSFCKKCAKTSLFVFNLYGFLSFYISVLLNRFAVLYKTTFLWHMICWKIMCQKMFFEQKFDFKQLVGCHCQRHFYLIFALFYCHFSISLKHRKIKIKIQNYFCCIYFSNITLNRLKMVKRPITHFVELQNIDHTYFSFSYSPEQLIRRKKLSKVLNFHCLARSVCRLFFIYTILFHRIDLLTR